MYDNIHVELVFYERWVFMHVILHILECLLFWLYIICGM